MVLPMGTRLVWDTDIGGGVTVAVVVVVVLVAAGIVVMNVAADLYIC